LVLATPEYIEFTGMPQTPADLAGREVFVIANGGEPATYRFRQGDDEVAVPVGSRVRVNTGEGVRAAVLSGLGIGIGSEWLFSPELRSGQLVEVVGGWELAPMDIWAVFATGRRAGAKARAFAAFVEGLLKEV
jgi:DNA-binding transcriptional LysR family regulator